VTRRSRLRGNDAALDAIGELIAAVRIQASAGLVIQGPAGSGKTRLLDEAAAMARRSGLSVACGVAVAGDQLVPMGPVRDALLQTPAGAAVMSGLDPLIDSTSGLLQGLRRVLVLAAQGGPLVICLDDLQWADAATVAALEAMPDLLADLPVGLLLAADLSRVITDMRGLGACLRGIGTWLHLRPLADDAVVQVITDVLGAEPGAELLAVAQHAQGNPAELLELLGGLQEDGLVRVVDQRAELVVSDPPERVRVRVRQRLRGLTPLGRQAVGVVALFEAGCLPDHVAAMLAIGLPAVAVAVHELEAATLVHCAPDGGIHVRDEILRQVILGALPRSGLAALRRQAADVLLEAGAGPLEVAELMVTGARPVDAVAARTLHSAAQALAGSDPAAGADLCRHAIGLVDYGDPLRGDLAALAVMLLHAAGRHEEGQRSAARWADEATSPDEQAVMLLRIAEMFTLSPDLRAEASRRALAINAVTAAPRARHHARLVANLVGAGRFAEADVRLRSVSDTVVQANDVEANTNLAVAEMVLDTAQGHYARVAANAVELQQRLRAGSAVVQLEFVTLLHGVALLALGDLQAARAGNEIGLRAAQDRGQRWAARMWAHQRLRVLLALGRPQEALAMSEPSAGRPPADVATNVSQASGLVATAQAAVRVGDLKLIAACAAAAEQTAVHAAPEVHRHATWILLQIADSRGDTDGVKHLLAAQGPALGEPVLPRYPPTPEDVVGLVRIALRVGNHGLALRTTGLARARAEQNPTSAYLDGLAAHAEGLLADDVGRLRAAGEHLGPSAAALARASVVEDLGRVLLQSTATASEAVACLDEALALYEDAGAHSDGARVRRRLRDRAEHRRLAASVPSTSGLAGLTDAERRVVDLVAAGLTNREVAARLYVSPNTVGTHLRHAFAKLGVRSRGELVLMMLTSPQRPPSGSRP
jgi:DNA-binding CsgD family transcriptional regulator